MEEKELLSLLFTAINHHNESLLDDLLSGENTAKNLIDQPGEDGNTLLHVAVLENDINCSICLLKHGANPNVFDVTRARSPLHLAVELGLTDIVATFLKLRHVNLELKDDRNLTCYEIAQFCDNTNLADLILDRRKHIEQFKDEFYTILNRACSDNEPKLVRELFERYERKILNDLPKDWHPYKDKRTYSRSILKDLINWSSSSWNYVTLLFKSASLGHTEVCKLLIDFGASAKCNESTNYSPLYVAAYGGHTKTAKLLLDNFPFLIHEVTIEKWTALHACCLQGHSDTAKLILNYSYPDSLKRRFITRSGEYEYEFSFNLNAQDAAGQTAIYLAVCANNEPLLDTLIQFTIEAQLVSSRSDQTNATSDQTDHRICSNTQRDKHGQTIVQSNVSNFPHISKTSIGLEVCANSRFYPSNQIDRIMRQLRRLQFSKESESPPTKENTCSIDDGGKYLICPFEMDTYCDYNSKTALHLAVCQKYHNIATTLLVNGSNPNLPILFRDPIKPEVNGFELNTSNGSTTGGSCSDIGLNWLRSSKSTCLKEACRLNDERMCEILIRYGARDNQDNLALQVAAMNKNYNLISMFLSLKSNIDPEYKINRKCNVEFASRYKQGQKLSGVNQNNSITTFSSMFPSTPITIDWRDLKCIKQLDPQWLIAASLAHNKRLRHPTNGLMAITRLDLSSNNFKSINPVIFRLPSLRHLNMSHNSLETLVDINVHRKKSQDEDMSTPTSKLIKSQRIAMKRSKSSQFTGATNLEISNVIDYNEPQEWDLPHLEVLDVQDNLLISLPDCLFDLPKLKELDVSNNQLRQLPWSIWTAPSLKDLNVSGNLLEDLPRAPPYERDRADIKLSTIPDSQDDTYISYEAENLLDQSPTFSSSMEANLNKYSPYVKILETKNHPIKDLRIEIKDDQVIHINHWSDRIELLRLNNLTLGLDPQDTNVSGDSISTFSKLSHLNLSQNSFRIIPPVLACVAPELTRLNMSHNSFEEMGDINLFPVKLKNLDLSNNQLVTWFSVNFQADDTKHCFTQSLKNTLYPKSRKPNRSYGSLHCVHKLHQRLDNLKSLNLSHNRLKDIQILAPSIVRSQTLTSRNQKSESTSSASRQSALLFPNLTALDVSFNFIQKVPEDMFELKDLSVLNLSGNRGITSLPAQLGLASKLWNLGVNECCLSDPLKSITESKTYKTMDLIGYLRSILEEAKPYARMKLMLVGLQGIGKTSLLEQMRQEGNVGFRRRAPEHWTKRMGHTSKGNLRNQKGVTLSTVGIDIHDWVYQKRTPRNQHSHGAVSFSTWDFGGQEEFYATHRYFLSRRSLYLVVWRLTDDMYGIQSIQQWLVNIQSRAPGSPVIIVGTHEDMIEGGERSEIVNKLQSEVHRRFINISDHDKCGLPRIMESVVVSAKTKLNIKYLCHRIYDVAFSLRCPGGTERLLEQRIPATYLYLEEIVSSITHDRHQKKREPVLTYDEYKRLASEQLKSKYNKTFRDLEPQNSKEINFNSELQQATRFLHENGVLLHYEDSHLRDLFFLDPQWLCDILSHVVTIREINPHVKNGLMKIEDLGHLFKSVDVVLGGGVQSYVVNLLNKFEVALTWNSQHLLIPSLLPESPESLDQQQNFELRIAPRVRGRSVVRRHDLNKVSLRSTSIDLIKKDLEQDVSFLQTTPSRNIYEFEYRLEDAVIRLVLLRYLPAGFIARLQTGILSDPAFDDACEDLHLKLINQVNVNSKNDKEFVKSIGSRSSWLCWKRGIRLMMQKESTINSKAESNSLTPNLLTIEELSSSDRESLVSQIDLKIECPEFDSESGIEIVRKNSNWIDLDISQYSNVIAVTIHNPRLKITNQDDEYTRYAEMDRLITAKLMSKAVDNIDDLLEDWYPSLGARFAHTLGGNYLVARIALCRKCSNVRPIQTIITRNENKICRESRRHLTRLFDRSTDASQPLHDAPDPRHATDPNEKLEASNIVYCYYVEHCILNAYELATLHGQQHPKISLHDQSPKKLSRVKDLYCPRHGAIPVSDLAPDVVFDDLPTMLKIQNEQIDRCTLIGRGALGFVFRGSLHDAFSLNQIGPSSQEVALKLLQPVDPGPEADLADMVAYNSAKTNWLREPFQSACKSYCNARHEINILLTLNHPNIVTFIGLCMRPLAIILELAPLGSLAEVFKNYKRSCSNIDHYAVQRSILQVAKALEFLHQNRIIYRDLKTENILVWSFPLPFATHRATRVELKLTDYGISRQALSIGAWKGFAGTMSYLAPEILRHNGDEEYTEKVDCFSFGMFLYELITLRPPYKQMDVFAASGGPSLGRNQFHEGYRPSITSRDLVYPSYMFDLMSLCWSQEPHNRPAASQIVSLVSTPEFIQIQDAVLIPASKDHKIHLVVDYGHDLRFWFGAKHDQLGILTSSQNQWTGLQFLDLNLYNSGSIQFLCLVQRDIWLCHSDGSVMITSAEFKPSEQQSMYGTISSAEHHQSYAKFSEDFSGPMSDEAMQFKGFSLNDQQGKSPKNIQSVSYVEHAQCVIFLTHDGLLWTCYLNDMKCCQLGDDTLKYSCITVPKQTCASKISSSQAQTLVSDSQPNYIDANQSPIIRLYCGQSNGISFLEIVDGEICRQSILPLATVAGNQSSSDSSAENSISDLDEADISHILTTGADDNYLWTASSCTVHLWNLAAKQVTRKLDCWKLIPCSESLESINIEHYYQQSGTSQITSMVHLNDQLYVGTSQGCIVIIEAGNLKPITVFRPYERDAIIIRPIFFQPNLIEDKSEQRKEYQPLRRYLVASGFGYRDLISRYLTNSILIRNDSNSSEESKLDSDSEKLVAILLAPVNHYDM